MKHPMWHLKIFTPETKHPWNRLLPFLLRWDESAPAACRTMQCNTLVDGPPKTSRTGTRYISLQDAFTGKTPAAGYAMLPACPPSGNASVKYSVGMCFYRSYAKGRAWSPWQAQPRARRGRRCCCRCSCASGGLHWFYKLKNVITHKLKNQIKFWLHHWICCNKYFKTRSHMDIFR
jgi:hypothetical protein